jgi:hypothetical protein
LERIVTAHASSGSDCQVGHQPVSVAFSKAISRS